MLIGNRTLVDLSRTTYILLIALLLPVFHPQLPANTILFDYMNGLFVFLFLGHCFLRHNFRVRLIGPFALILVGSLIGMLNSQNAMTNVLAIAQESYLLIFFLILYNIIESRKDFQFLLLCLLCSASLQGALLFLEMADNPSARAHGTFLNANMAGAYVGMFFFLVFSPGCNKKGIFRAICAAAILSGVVATKSLGTTFGVALGSTSIVLLWWFRASTMNKAKVVFISIGIALLLAPIASRVSEIANYGDRSERSAHTRFELWTHGLRTFFDNPLGVAVGPAGFKVVSRGPLNKEGTAIELHNDYLAFLVERGIFGFVGLLSLLASIGILLWRCWVNASSGKESLWVASLCGMFLFTLTNMFTHELMHYRFLWLGFALIAIQARLSVDPCSTTKHAARKGHQIASQTV